MAASKKWTVCVMIEHIFLRAIAVLVFIFQSAILNQLMVIHHDNIWYCWYVADVVILLLFVVAFYVSFKYVVKTDGKQTLKVSPPTCSTSWLGQFPWGSFAWFAYAAFLAARVGIIFFKIADVLKEEDLLGPNTLRMAISLSSVVFMFVVFSQRSIMHTKEQKAKLKFLVGSISMDILDTVTFLNPIFIQESKIFLSFELHKSIILIACFNLVLPTLELLMLSRSHYFDNSRAIKEIELAHTTTYFLFINLPMLTIRCILWNVHNQDVSVFLIKNTLGIIMVLKNIYDYVKELYMPKPDEDKHENIELQETSPPVEEGEVLMASSQPTQESQDGESSVAVQL